MKNYQWRWVSNQEGRIDKVIAEALSNGAGTCSAAGDGFPEHLKEMSRNRIQDLIKEGQILVNNGGVKPNSRIRVGDHILMKVPEPKALQVQPQNIPLEIMYEDDHLLVVNKPPGLTVHPSPTQTEHTLVHALLYHVKELSGIGGVLRPGIVHRLDKDTSGALVVTKSDLSHQRLVEAFSKHNIDRKYWALCYGPWKPNKAILRVESLIGRNPADRKKMAMDIKGGRKAVSHFRLLQQFGESRKSPFASWIEATLETGRTHQVRVHLTSLGNSILGDPVYGKPSSNHTKWKALPREIQALVSELPGQALHARTLGFIHPISGKKMNFEAEPPRNFKLLLDALRAYK